MKIMVSNKEKTVTYMLFTLACNGIPTLVGIKPASILHFQRKYITDIPTFLYTLNTELDKFACSYDVIFIDDRSLYILLYHKHKLEELIDFYSNHKLLLENGYSTKATTLECYLEVLKKRYAMHMISKTEFPHEIGLFLGYPIRDVEEYIRNKGRNYLINGYWKVYENVEEALHIFQQYTLLREEAIQLFYQGKEITEVKSSLLTQY